MMTQKTPYSMLQLMCGPLSQDTPTSLTFQQFLEYLSLITSSGLVHRLLPLFKCSSHGWFPFIFQVWTVMACPSMGLLNFSFGSKSPQCCPSQHPSWFLLLLLPPPHTFLFLFISITNTDWLFLCIGWGSNLSTWIILLNLANNPRYQLGILISPIDMTHLKRLWCWERLKAGGEGDNRGWDDWMA